MTVSLPHGLHPVRGPGRRVARQRPARRGGCLLDMGYHLVDLLLWYFGMPQRVLAQCSATAPTVTTTSRAPPA